MDRLAHRALAAVLALIAATHAHAAARTTALRGTLRVEAPSARRAGPPIASVSTVPVTGTVYRHRGGLEIALEAPTVIAGRTQVWRLRVPVATLPRAGRTLTAQVRGGERAIVDDDGADVHTIRPRGLTATLTRGPAGTTVRVAGTAAGMGTRRAARVHLDLTTEAPPARPGRHAHLVEDLVVHDPAFPDREDLRWTFAVRDGGTLLGHVDVFGWLDRPARRIEQLGIAVLDEAGDYRPGEAKWAHTFDAGLGPVLDMRRAVAGSLAARGLADVELVGFRRTGVNPGRDVAYRLDLSPSQALSQGALP